MKVDARYAVAPQMADYERMGGRWTPYLMNFHAPLVRLRSVTTDEWGLRNTVSKDGDQVRFHDAGLPGNARKLGVVLGSSTVFGVGATHDRFTIPSLLNAKTDTLWLNCAGRAFNSTQEVLLLLLHLPECIDRLVLFSGVNNATLAFASGAPSPVYNSYFHQSRFENAMSHPAKEHVGVRRAFKYLMEETRHRFRPQREAPARSELGNNYDAIMACFRRDLRAVKALTTGLGAEPACFALQPLATWIEKALSKEEREIFSILDGLPMDWQILAHSMAGIRDRYFHDVESACLQLDVPFCNMNLEPEFRSSEWLFVDRVHLTDRGYELAADILKRRFSL